ncbi:MAG: glycosyltransferase family 4 protein [Myxococcota bacterium]
MGPKRLLLISPELGVAEDGTYRPGGLQAFSRMVALALAGRRGLTALTVWSLLDSDRAMQRTLVPYLGTKKAPSVAIAVRGFGGDRRAMALAYPWARLRHDHAQFLHLGVGRLAALLPLLPYSLWEVGIETRRPLSLLERTLLARARPLLSISDFTSDETRRFNPSVPRATTVHLAVEPDAFWTAPSAPERAAPTPLAAPSEAPAARRPLVIIVARLAASERYKGHDQLVDAWPSVVAAVPEARLCIVGSGDDLARLEARAKALPSAIAARIELAGRVSHERLDELYRTAAVFAMPSTGEGFGLVFCEAMRHGLPCIAGPDSAKEIVLDGVTGRVVAQTPEAIAAACVELLSDPDKAQRMGRAGLRRFEETFVFERFAERYLAAMGLP